MKLAILGYGTIGAGVYELAKRAGLEPTRVLDLREVPEGTKTTMQEILADPEIELVVETMGGLHPAFEYALSALEAGKHLVTANKFLVSEYGDRLAQAAREHHVSFRFSAACGGGIPFLPTLQDAARFDRIARAGGILNGTTNFMLDRMERFSESYEAALSRAQELGYAERDPSSDVSGADIRRKLVISSNIAYGRVIDENDVDVCGIEQITDGDIAAFRRMGRVCKLFAASRKLERSVVAYIEPTLMTPAMPESAIPTNNNLISLTGERIGKQSFYGQGAGRYPTAYNVLQDCVDVSRGWTGFYTDRLEPTAVDNRSVVRQYYVRTNGVDAWLKAHIEKVLDRAVITTPVSVAELHAWARARRAVDPECFFASLR